MKLDKAPTESYADIGGLEQQIQEIKVSDSHGLVRPHLILVVSGIRRTTLDTPGAVRRNGHQAA